MDYKKYLTDDILDFWLKNAIDDKEGGIFTQLDKKGNIYGEEKSVWFQGRALSPVMIMLSTAQVMRSGAKNPDKYNLIAKEMLTEIINGGIIAFRDALDYSPTSLEWDMKLWWTQCEAIIANLLAFKVFGEQRYYKNYKTLLKYAFDNFADKQNGEWYGYLHYDNTPSNYLKGNIFKGPFHLPRMLMIVHALEAGEKIEDFMK